MLRISTDSVTIFMCAVTFIDEKIAEMERHLKTLAEKLRMMKATKKKEKTERKSSSNASQEKSAKPKTASKAPAKPPAKAAAKAPAKPAPAKAPAVEKKKAPVRRSKPVYSSSSSGSSSSDEEDVPLITFEQKKELSDSINNFSGDKLANVVQIIHSSMPHLRDVSVGCCSTTPCPICCHPAERTNPIHLNRCRMAARRRLSLIWTRLIQEHSSNCTST